MRAPLAIAAYRLLMGGMFWLSPLFCGLAEAQSDSCSGITGFSAYACEIDAWIADGLCSDISIPGAPGTPAISTSFERGVAKKFNAAGTWLARSDEANPRRRVRLLIAAYWKLFDGTDIAHAYFYKIYRPCFDRITVYGVTLRHAIFSTVCDPDAPRRPRQFCR